MDLRSTRLSGEWEFATDLANENPTLITHLQQNRDGFTMILHETPGIIFHDCILKPTAVHEVRFDFPRYFPAMPIEAYLSKPVFHPNVNDVSGFACIWDRHSSGQTIIEAVSQLRKVISWQLVNGAAEHVMQPEAWKLFNAGNLAPYLPLNCVPLRMPEKWVQLRHYKVRDHRPRLSPL